MKYILILLNNYDYYKLKTNDNGKIKILVSQKYMGKK